MITHLEVPFKVSTVGYYVNTACGAYLPTPHMTADRSKVTCRGCQRTRRFTFDPNAVIQLQEHLSRQVPAKSSEED